MASDLTLVQVTCPHCEKLQQIVADWVQARQIVRCSGCRDVIGRWRDLVVVTRYRSAPTLLRPAA
jgi:hypothetical protein